MKLIEITAEHYFALRGDIHVIEIDQRPSRSISDEYGYNIPEGESSDELLEKLNSISAEVQFEITDEVILGAADKLVAVCKDYPGDRRYWRYWLVKTAS